MDLLQYGNLLGWAIPVLLIAYIMGAASQEYGETIENIGSFEGFTIASEMFLFALIGVLAAVVPIYTMQSLLRMRTEEDGGPLESVLATAVSRLKFMASHILCSVFGSFALPVIFALGLSLASSASASETGEYIKMALYQGTAILALAGFITAVYGFLPKISKTVSFIAVIAGLLAGPFMGALMDLPEAIQKLSPFTHVGVVPADVAAGSIAGLFVIAVILGALGIAAFNHRS